MRTGKGRGLAAGLFALAVLCHLIVGIFAAVATLLMFLLYADRKRTRYLITMVPVAGLLTAFWTLPFLLGGAYMTDMTYERRPVGNAPNGQPDSYWQMLFPYSAWVDRLVFALAAIGLVACVIRGRRIGTFLGLVAITFGVWACVWPQSHLWNARLLPFMYLARYLLAFIGSTRSRRWSCATPGSSYATRPAPPARPVVVAGWPPGPTGSARPPRGGRSARSP